MSPTARFGCVLLPLDALLEGVQVVPGPTNPESIPESLHQAPVSQVIETCWSIIYGWFRDRVKTEPRENVAWRQDVAVINVFGKTD